MKWFLVAAVWVVVAIVAMAAGVVGMVRLRLRARHRINPKVPTDTPYLWMLSPATPARLHRRLAKAMAVARDGLERTRPPKRRLRRKLAPSPLDPLVAKLDAEALAVDRHLLLVSRLGGGERQRLLAHLDGQVRQVEHLAGRVAMLGVQAASPIERIDGPTAIDEVESQVALLEQSRTELAALDRANGLITTVRLPEALSTPAEFRPGYGQPLADPAMRTQPRPPAPQFMRRSSGGGPGWGPGREGQPDGAVRPAAPVEATGGGTEHR